MHDQADLGAKLTLPCGATLPNRIAKAAMSEQLARRGGVPGAMLGRLYEAWSRGGAGLLITGNVMVDRRHLESPKNVVLAGVEDLDPFRAWAAAGKVNGGALWAQLNHPGRQTPRYVNPRPLGPSAGEPVRLFGRRGAFGRPRAMSVRDIEEVIAQFADAAKKAVDAGFDGVQIHGAHGYLVSQFLSPLVNRRRDEWGGSLECRARLLLAVVASIRGAIGSERAIGVKLNSADFQRGGFDERDSLEVLAMLSDAGVDLVEISGGSYEAHAMFDRSEARASTPAREAYFLEYARSARRTTRVPLMVTGGFRRRATMQRALDEDACDVIGMARPFALEADIAARLLAGAPEAAYRPRSVGHGGAFELLSDGGYCVYAISEVARGRTVDPGASLGKVLARTALAWLRQAAGE